MISKRILFLLPSLRSGGAERQAVTIAVLLKQLGYDVEFLVYFKEGFYEPILSQAGIKINRKVCNYLRRMIYVTNVVRHGHYDIVISFMPTPNFLNGFAAFLLGKGWKMIISERTALESNLTSRKGRIYGFFYRRTDAIVCNSNNACNLWRKNYPFLSGRLHTIYNTVTLGKIDTSYLPFRNNRLNVVVAATIYSVKNPMGLMEALAMMTNEERNKLHIDWYGKTEAIIGDHMEYDKVVNYIRNQHLEDVVTLHNATKDIANRMNEADCVALFSQLEGLPNAICEGMMLSKPIIMSRCSDYNVLIEEGVNGYLCDWDNPSSIKDALLKLANHSKEQWIAMGESSKEKAEHLFSKDVIIQKWLDVIEG